MLKWTEKFEIGNKLLDAQHRMLIAYINRLEFLSKKASFTQEDMALILRFVEFLEAYILTHFQEEENCMHRFRCPAYLENKKAHSEFLDFYRKLKLRLGSDGFRPEVVAEMFEFCVIWIQMHILRIDVRLKPCLDREPPPLDEPE